MVVKEQIQEKEEVILASLSPNNIVTKANSLVEASFELSLIEFKIVHAAMSKVRVTDEEFYNIAFKVKELATLCKIGMTDAWTGVKKATEKIMSRVLYFEDEDGKQVMAHWFASAKYSAGSGLLELKIDNTLKPLLLNLQREFTSVRLSELVEFTSVYSTRIYELLSQYKKLSVRQIELDEFKRILKINSKAYVEFSNIKARIIEPAMAEINKKTNYNVRCEYKKTGRKVTSLIFSIKLKKGEIIDLDISVADVSEEVARKKNIYDYLVKVELEKQLEYFSNKYDTERIIENVNYTLDYAKKSSIENLAGYASRAIEVNYANRNEKHSGEQDLFNFDEDEIANKIKEEQHLLLVDNKYEDNVPSDPYLQKIYKKFVVDK